MPPEGFGDIEGVHSEVKEGVKESYRRVDIIEEVEDLLDTELPEFGKSKGRMNDDMVSSILNVLPVSVESESRSNFACLERVLNDEYGLGVDVRVQTSYFSRDDWWKILELLKREGDFV